MKAIIHDGSDGQCSGDCCDNPRLHWAGIRKRPGFAVVPHAKDAGSGR